MLFSPNDILFSQQLIPSFHNIWCLSFVQIVIKYIPFGLSFALVISLTHRQRKNSHKAFRHCSAFAILQAFIGADRFLLKFALHKLFQLKQSVAHKRH